MKNRSIQFFGPKDRIRNAMKKVMVIFITICLMLSATSIPCSATEQQARDFWQAATCLGGLGILAPDPTGITKAIGVGCVLGQACGFLYLAFRTSYAEAPNNPDPNHGSVPTVIIAEFPPVNDSVPEPLAGNLNKSQHLMGQIVGTSRALDLSLRRYYGAIVDENLDDQLMQQEAVTDFVLELESNLADCSASLIAVSDGIQGTDFASLSTNVSEVLALRDEIVASGHFPPEEDFVFDALNATQAEIDSAIYEVSLVTGATLSDSDLTGAVIFERLAQALQGIDIREGLPELEGFVMRNLPCHALAYNETYAGDTFDVYVNFTAPVGEFNSIGLTDLAPDGWIVQVNKTWCTPNAYTVQAWGNEAEILWSGPFAKGTNFTAMYKVTVPVTATPGVNLWPDCDASKGWLEFYFGEEGPYKMCVWGDYEMVVTVPGDIVGKTRDVNANPLADVEVALVEKPDIMHCADSSTPNFTVTANTTGWYYLHSTKALYYDINMTDMTMLPDKWINLTTPELLAAGYVFDFEGNYGLVPRACTMSYAIQSVNLWLFPPAAHPEWGISEWKAMESIHSWQYPT